jgi:transcriptional regulator with XRE-family HTH domain
MIRQSAKEMQRNLAIYQRLDEAFNAIGMTKQTERAKALGVDQPTISKWKTGQHAPSFQRLMAIAEITGYAIEYLAMGNGPRIVAPGDSASDQINRILQAAPEGERARYLRLLQALEDNRAIPQEP